MAAKSQFIRLGRDTVTVLVMLVSSSTLLVVIIVLPRKAVTSSGAELPAAINVAPATS